MWMGGSNSQGHRERREHGSCALLAAEFPGLLVHPARIRARLRHVDRNDSTKSSENARQQNPNAIESGPEK
jgi:hypothetical protein